MDWKRVGQVVGSAAPLFGRLLAGPSGAAVGEIIAGVLGTRAEPEQVIEAINKRADADQLLIAAEQYHHRKLSSLLLEERKAVIAANTQAMQATNNTMRAEIKAEHWFYRSWRPASGWIVMLAFFLTILNANVLLWIAPEALPNLVSFISSSTMLWTFAFAVVGVYVHKRSVDKQLEAGYPTPSLTEKTLDKGREQLEKVL